jgi:lipoprotein-releasing system ATP-binding protein
MLEAIDIVKQYGPLQVLQGASLSVAAGEVVSVVGASGAGKSTLLHILGTLDRPDAGLLRIDGQEVGRMPERALAQFRNRRLGFVFQFHNLLPEFSALENACMPALIAGKTPKEAEALAMPLLELLHVAGRARHKPSEMSGGEQQRVAVARALVNRPAVVFADEPSGNLDVANADDLHRLFFRLRDEMGQTFVIVTHNPAFADMADRKLRIAQGRVQEEARGGA